MFWKQLLSGMGALQSKLRTSCAYEEKKNIQQPLIAECTKFIIWISAAFACIQLVKTIKKSQQNKYIKLKKKKTEKKTTETKEVLSDQKNLLLTWVSLFNYFISLQQISMYLEQLTLNLPFTSFLSCLHLIQ